MEAEPGIEPRYTDLQAVDFLQNPITKQLPENMRVDTHSLNPLRKNYRDSLHVIVLNPASSVNNIFPFHQSFSIIAIVPRCARIDNAVRRHREMY